MSASVVSIRIENLQSREIESEVVHRHTGLVPLSSFGNLIGKISMHPNPRLPSLNDVAKEIQISLDEDQNTFHLQNRGVLLSCAGINRYTDSKKLKIIVDEECEDNGILDGGHTTFAIALYIIRKSIEAFPDSAPNKTKPKSWGEMKSMWIENNEAITQYLTSNVQEQYPLIPVEFLLKNDAATDVEFKKDIDSISSARNRNTQLKERDRLNKEGVFNIITEIHGNEDWCKHTIFRSQEQRDDKDKYIQLEAIVRLAIIPFSIDGCEIGRKISGSTIYNGVANALEIFDAIVNGNDNAPKLSDTMRHSGILILKDIVNIYDELYMQLPIAYNLSGGKFGALTNVKLDPKGKTPIFRNKCDYSYPEAYLKPLIWSLKNCMVIKKNTIVWKKDPYKFMTDVLHNHELMSAYCSEVRTMIPDKFGKKEGNYGMMISASRIHAL